MLREPGELVQRSRLRHSLPEGLAATETANGDERRDIVRQAVRRLPRRAREVIVLHYFSGLSHSEVAAALGVSPQAVHGRLIRARRKIGEDLERNGFRKGKQWTSPYTTTN